MSNPFNIEVSDSEALFILEPWQMEKIARFDSHGTPQPFQHVYAFVKNNQVMTSYDFKTTLEAIRDLLDAKSVNCGILMFMHGTYVFTEVPIDFNPMLVKLAAGVNFKGQVTSSISNLDAVNKFMGR